MKKLVYIFKRINKKDNYIIDTNQFKTNKTAKKREQKWKLKKYILII